jgi:hypothetical protein
MNKQSTQPAKPEGNPAKPDETHVDLTSPQASTSPSMPHERDEGGGMTGGVPSREDQQGHRDLKRGIEDTSRAPEADETYRQLKKK